MRVSATGWNRSTSKPFMAEQAPKIFKIPESSSLTSALAAPLPPEAQALYSEVLTALNEHGVPYAVA